MATRGKNFEPRSVTKEDEASPVWRMCNSHSQENWGMLVIRAGEVVRNTVEVVPISDPEKVLVLNAGSTAPEGSDYFPTNYINRPKAQRDLHAEAEMNATGKFTEVKN